HGDPTRPPVHTAHNACTHLARRKPRLNLVNRIWPVLLTAAMYMYVHWNSSARTSAVARSNEDQRFLFRLLGRRRSWRLNLWRLPSRRALDMSRGFPF